ncbi:MAG: hypothetical protein EAX95_15800 [Candidatus Thorarchaeota archaeon]|nr:hypothetical protein [Candidatus Thorarchaeota archaeon]
MGKRLILGTEPEVDPLKEMAGEQPAIQSGRSFSWNDRQLKRRWSRDLVILASIAVLGIYSSVFLFALSSSILIIVLLLPKMRMNLEPKLLQNSNWSVVPETDLTFQVASASETLQCRGVGGHRHMAAMDLGEASPRLLGGMSSLIRSVDTSDGFYLSVTLKPEDIETVLDRELLSEGIEKYLSTLPGRALESYVVGHGGLWSTRVLTICHGRDEEISTRIETAVAGAVPEAAWVLLGSAKLRSMLIRKETSAGQTRFYGSGRELSEWLVQLPSELASEVGPSIPGEFIAPIRPRSGDYDLGVIINPETLQKGARAGISHGDLESGLIVCGGTSEERRSLLTGIVRNLISSEKRVIVVSTQQSALELASLDESAVGFELGRNYVINPVDAEGIPRHIYIPKLLLALQTLCSADLRGAVDFELALGRVVALGNTTIADVKLNGADDIGDAYSPNAGSASDPSPASVAGMEAIKRLHQGTAARAFYGTQTARMKDLAQTKLSVIAVPLGTPSLLKFALDVLSIKLAGLQREKSLVIIMEDAENLRTRNQPHLKRDAWSETILRDLRERGPTIISLDHPADMAPGALGQFSSCISLRLREAADMKVAVELLGISVVSGGMYSKARHSARETSFLRVMPDGVALVVRNRGETCMPFQIDESPYPTPPPSSEELARRAERIVPEHSMRSEPRAGGSLLDLASGGESELAVSILKLLQRYEPLTEEAVRRFISTSGYEGEPDIEGVLARLEHSSMILRGHESHGGVSYTNYRLTMKGSMTLRQFGQLDGGQE